MSDLEDVFTGTVDGLWLELALHDPAGSKYRCSGWNLPASLLRLGSGSSLAELVVVFVITACVPCTFS